MDTSIDAQATRFALEILRKHPQISFANARAAAEYAGLEALPRTAFDAAVEELGIDREPDESTPGAGVDGVEESQLIAQLEALRDDFAETEAMRGALVDIQRLVRAVLDQDGSSPRSSSA
jgi:hypothetical protein